MKKGVLGKKIRKDSQLEPELTSEWVLQSIMDCVQDYLIVFDEEEKVRYISASAVEKFGLEPEAQERTIADFSKLRLNGHTLGELLMIVDRGHPLNEMVRVEMRDYVKEPWWAAVNAYVLSEDSNSRTVLILLKDVTEYLKTTEKEIESNLVRENLLYTVSHCVKTSLNAIVGTVELMRTEENARDREKHLFTLQQASEKMVSMLDEILDFTKAESGKLELREKEYAVVPMLEQLYSYAFQAEEQGKRLYMFVSTDIPKAIVGDAKRVQQAISNLLYIFMMRPAKESRAVELHVTTAEQDVAEIMLQVEVRGDTAAMPNIIRKTSGKGDVCFRSYDSNEILCEFKYYAVVDLVRLMGGEIYTEQRASGTTIIRFEVPLLTGASENIIPFKEFKGTKVAIDAADEHLFMHLVRVARELNCDVVKVDEAEFVWSEETVRAPYSTMLVADYMRSEIKRKCREFEPVLRKLRDVTVLIVDDNEVNCMVAAKLLGTLGAKTETAADGSIAIEKVKEKDYDVILMDHLMPGMDGVEATKQIRKLEEAGKKKTLLIALTANLMDSVITLFEEAGADLSMAKPIDFNKLKKTLEAFLPKEKLIFEEGREEYGAPEQGGEAVKPKVAEFLKNDELRRLSEVCPELDMERGLAGAEGDEARYLQMLNATKKSIATILEHFDRLALSEKEELYADIHSLKGIFSSIGAEHLKAEAVKLEHALATEGKLKKESYQRFYRHCGNFETQLEQCIFSKEEAEYIPLSAAETKEWKEIAQNALRSYEFDTALEAVLRLAVGTSGETRDQLLKVVSEIENFSYETAYKMLEQCV